MRTASLCNSAMRTASSSESVRRVPVVWTVGRLGVTCACTIAGNRRPAAVSDVFRSLPSLRARGWFFVEDTVQDEGCFDRLVYLFVVLREPFSTPRARSRNCAYMCAAFSLGCG